MTQEETSTLELRDYIQVLRRHKWIIAITLVVCVGAAVAMATTRDAVYSTSGSVLLEERLVDRLFLPDALGSSNSLVADRRRANEIAVMGSAEVRDRVKEQLGYPPEGVSFTPQVGNDVVTIASSGRIPKRISETVNAYADVYIATRVEQRVTEMQQAIDQVQTLKDEVDKALFGVDVDLALNPPVEQIVNGRNIAPTDPRIATRAALAEQSGAYDSQIGSLQQAIAVAQQGGARVLSRSDVPTTPINEGPTRNLIAGLAIGIVLAIALAFLREYLDDTVKSKDDLERATGLGVIGIIPELPDWKKRESTPLIAMLQPRSPAAEAYRSVRTSVEFLSLDQPIGSIQVTSAHASEGKTSTLANLAVTFARAGQRVIVLCCDLRRPRVHEFFGLSNRVGFTSILLGDTPLAQAIQPADPDLPIGVVASGPLPPNPAELLSSKRAVEVIEELDRRCDILMIDSPPILPVTDGLVLSGMVDAVIIVGSAGNSTKRGVKRASEMLRQVDAPLIGAILNGVGSKLEYGYAYGTDDRYYLESKPDRRSSKGRRKAPEKDTKSDGSKRPQSPARATH